MWNDNGGFFNASFYNDDVSIESNMKPKQLLHEHAVLVHEYTVPSVHAHHYALYTKKKTGCGCFAKATNVIVETFHTSERPTADVLITYFNGALTVAKDTDELQKSCDQCESHWSPIMYYSDIHYTNVTPDASVTISFDPHTLLTARAIYVQQAPHSSTSYVYIQKPHCDCFEEAGKLTLAATDKTAAEWLQQRFNVTIVEPPVFTQRCQTCLPAPTTWSQSAHRFGHYEKYTSFGIMYSTFLSETLAPTGVYEVEPNIFILTQQKSTCHCAEDLAQIETTTSLSVEMFAQFLHDEFGMHVTPLHTPPSFTCAQCAEVTFMLP